MPAPSTSGHRVPPEQPKRPAKKRFLLRVDPRLHAAIERWAADDFRSVNSQIEFILAEATRRAGRLKAIPPPHDDPPEGAGSSV